MIDNPALYFITDSTGLTQEKFLSIIEEACKGGVSLVQLREKNRSDRDFLALGFKVKAITERYDIRLLIDDRLDIAMILNCGVHLGQDDIPIAQARAIMGKDALIGATTKTVAHALEAQAAGADYLGVGAIFPTTTKVKTIITKITSLNDICNRVSIPVMAIGGLNKDNYTILKDSPIQGMCVVSAIMKSPDPQAEARNLKQGLKRMLKRP